MLSSGSPDDEDLPKPWKTRIAAALAVAVIAAISIGFTVRHENTPPAVVFEPAEDGARPTPLPPGDEAGHATSSDPTAATSTRTSSARSAPASPPSAVPANGGPTANASTSGATLMVHVSGHVRSPGVYRLPAGSRVIDAVNAAGGAASDADTDKLNLAAYAEDGSHINVPGTPVATPVPPPPQPPAAAPGQAMVPGAPGTAAVAAAPPAPDRNRSKSAQLPQQPVDLNTASMAELQTLPTVGPEMATRILEYRNVHGAFHSVEELNQIEGIGDKKLDKLRPYVVVN